jgi:hypothetical protein
MLIALGSKSLRPQIRLDESKPLHSEILNGAKTHTDRVRSLGNWSLKV